MRTDMDADLVRQIAPKGVLRASINLSNRVLASPGEAGGDPRGVSVDLARALAGRLGLALQPITFDGAGRSVEAVAAGDADIGFFALDPARAAQLTFTAPYVLIEGAYLVRQPDALLSADEVDQVGHRVVVVKGTAYDLHLTRTLRHATLVRTATTSAALDEFLDTGAHVVAGVRQQLEADCRRVTGLRLLAGCFMTIQQAMALPASRSDAAVAVVRQFLEDMKADGFVARALARHGISGAVVAPLA
ncbi:transporter substrate-binding domain-containing protein [Aquabacterium sp. J223]|nr:transporter substrate-binding domain-containing protein [Aquabacterium sp. J223]